MRCEQTLTFVHAHGPMVARCKKQHWQTYLIQELKAAGCILEGRHELSILERNLKKYKRMDQVQAGSTDIRLLHHSKEL